MKTAKDILGHSADAEDHAEDAADHTDYTEFRSTLSHLKKGALHRQLGVPVGKKIPHSDLEKAAKSSDALLAKRARLALTMEGWSHGHDGAHEEEFGLSDHKDGK